MTTSTLRGMLIQVAPALLQVGVTPFIVDSASSFEALDAGQVLRPHSSRGISNRGRHPPTCASELTYAARLCRRGTSAVLSSEVPATPHQGR